jgi:hypothetical protein
MKTSKTLQVACDYLISKVRLENAVLCLSTTDFSKDDTPAIREATRIYVESWIVPVLEAIKTGNLNSVAILTGQRNYF